MVIAAPKPQGEPGAKYGSACETAVTRLGTLPRDDQVVCPA